MRWFWIDRFTEFVRSDRSAGIKNICLTEPQILDYQPGFPVMPRSLIVEGLAQTGGLLVAEHFHYDKRVVLAKVGRARFHGHALVGDTLRYQAKIERADDAGAFVTAQSHIGERLHGEFELFFAFLDDSFPGDNWDPADFISMLRLLGIYDVGVDENGKRLVPPRRFLQAEAEAIGAPAS